MQPDRRPSIPRGLCLPVQPPPPARSGGMDRGQRPSRALPLALFQGMLPGEAGPELGLWLGQCRSMLPKSLAVRAGAAPVANCATVWSCEQHSSGRLRRAKRQGDPPVSVPRLHRALGPDAQGPPALPPLCPMEERGEQYPPWRGLAAGVPAILRSASQPVALAIVPWGGVDLPPSSVWIADSSTLQVAPNRGP
jgi:hypothetical protein